MVGSSASASQGSVPSEVTGFTTDPNGLLFQLNDLFGVGASGEGIDFDETTKAGPISRVFVWTDDFVAGVKTDEPVRRLNEWVTPVSVRDSMVGFAVISIDADTVDPELASFVTGSVVAGTLSELPDDAFLVNDTTRSAWFSLLGKSLTPIVRGTSGMTKSTELTAYQLEVARAVPAPAASDPGFLAGGLALLIAILATLAVIFVPDIRHRLKSRASKKPKT
jgi:hypothetical protein